jgi:homocysteine S-methyltransferase
MARYRSALPQLSNSVFLTDGGLETSLVFHDRIDLPCFAAFPLVLSPAGRARLARYFEPYLAIAAENRAGFILDTPTWRANADWGERLGFSAAELFDINKASVAMAEELRQSHNDTDIVVNGVLGPRGDGYKAGTKMTVEAARSYHAQQIAAFVEGGADMVSAVTMTYVEEAVGIALAARDHGMPVAISFTVETDGFLPSGSSLESAVEVTDALTGGYPAYYMVNCAHPLHFTSAIAGDAPWLERIRGIRANASTKSHAELDEATELDAGDPADLGLHYRALRRHLRRLSIVGGCCGTDHRHVRAMCEACLPAPQLA